MNYYNEFDPAAAMWIQQLIDGGHIPAGWVDTRSIDEVQPQDLEGFTQCHFFAGIAGWSLALKLAGWPATRPVWTGSCPCQPFSNAGKKLGEEDSRHLWPVFQRLISQCRPATVFGEQVASAAGRQWFAGVRADLEALGYGVGGADLCAAGVGAPHIRQRIFWVAHAHRLDGDRAGHVASDDCGKQCGENRLQGQRDFCGLANSAGMSGAQQFGEPRKGLRREQAEGNATECAGSGGVANAGHKPARGGSASGQEEGGQSLSEPARRCPADGVENTTGGQRGKRCGVTGENALPPSDNASGSSGVDGVGHSNGGGREPREQTAEAARHGGSIESTGDSRGAGNSVGEGLEGHTGDGCDRNQPGRQHEDAPGPASKAGSSWDYFDILQCTDGKARRVESGVCPLAHGVPGRVGLLRGYGNAIVPQVAAVFIQAAVEAIERSESGS